MLGCGCGTCCASCASKGKLNGYGDASVSQFPRIEAILLKYVLAQLKAGNDFYISPSVNSQVLRSHYMGQFDDILSAVESLAGNVGQAVGLASSISGGGDILKNGLIPGLLSSGGSSAPATTSDQITAQVIANLQADGINLPSSVANQTVGAGLADLFGPREMPFWLVGGGILLLVLLMR